MAETYFCTATDVKEYYSEVGAEFQTDDLAGDNESTTETSALDRCRGEATDLIAQYATQRYDFDDLAGSPWVQRRATILACYFLSMRRGNQPPLPWAMRHDQILIEMEKLIQGIIQIPDLIPNEANTPVVSGQVVDPRYRYSKLRTIPSDTNNQYAGRKDIQDYFVEFP